MDAFISWTGRDRDVKNVLVEKLRAAGISCWDSDEYCTSDYSRECIDAIKRCGVFIVIVSDASMQTGYVKNEIIAARKQEEAGLLNMLVYKITDAPYTDDFEFQLNHISFVTGNLLQRRENLRGDSGIDMLVTRAKRLLQLRQSGEPEKPFSVTKPSVEGWQLTGSTGYFVENSRNDILEAVHTAFMRSNAIVLTEFVGYGKRSVIRKYLSMHSDEITTAIMVDNQWGSLRNFLISGLRFSNLNPVMFNDLEGDALITAKLRQLEKLDRDTLLVIPDLELPEDRELYQRLLSLRCRIILLTQNSAESCCDLLPVIQVGKMEDSYLMELFFHHYTRADEVEREQLKSPLEEYFGQIGGHTKTVELTASVLNRDMGIMPGQVPSVLSLHGVEGMALKDRVLNQLSHLFVMEQLTPVQIKALVIAACLAVPYLSEQHFRQLLKDCEGDTWQEIMELDSRRWLDLDLKNGTVSIEPLVAQIVIQRFPEEKETLLRCLNYLQDAYMRQLSVADSTGFIASNLARVEHFFRINGLEILSELAEAMIHTILYGEGREALAAAVAQFQREYPEEAFGTDPEDLNFMNQQGELAYCAQYFVRSYLLTVAKLNTNELANVLLDYSTDNSRILEHFSQKMVDMSLDMESIVGISREELERWRETLQQSLSQVTEGQETLESFFLVEAMSVIDAMYRRDYQAMLLGTESLLQRSQERPELLYDSDLANMFYSCIGTLANVYITSKAYTAAVRLCEKALANPCNSNYRLLLKKYYIQALQHTNQYGETLFEMFEQLLQDMEEEGEQIFENRQELILEKQRWTFQYARCLTMGEECLRAKEWFDRACKNTVLAPDLMVETAWEIGDGLIRSGEFESARQFFAQYFSPEKREHLTASCDDARRDILIRIGDLLALDAQVQNDFEANIDPECHLSYYHAYSRKNNSLLDRKYCAVADRAMEFDFEDLTDEQISAHARKLRSRSSRESLLQLAPEAFALASEAGFRVLGYRHHYVQLMGAAAMVDGKIAEILNGEGKTYTIVAVAFLQWLFGKKVYVVDESPYLTQRNCNWMCGVYRLLGMECCYIPDSSAVKTTKADVYYITLKEMIFAYLCHEADAHSVRSGLKMDVAIIDEADTVLVDLAKQQYNFVYVENDPEAMHLHMKAWELVEGLDLYGEDFAIRDKQVSLLPAIYTKMEKTFGISWDALEQLQRIRQIEQLVRLAILCRFGYEENKDYFIHKGLPVKEDRSRGTFAPIDPSVEYFLCRQNELDCGHSKNALMYRKLIANTICIRDFFRKFRTVCGTTATAVSFSKEFKEIYDLEYVAIPPHSPVVRQDTQSPLYTNVRHKDRAIIEMVAEKQSRRQPVLLITQSIAESEKYHRLLKRAGIPHSLLNAKNAEEAADVLSTAGMPGSVLVANALVSRGADIRLGGNPERETLRTLVEMGTDISGLEDFLYRLPTPEQRESELYKKYYSILEQNKLLFARQRKEVVEAGGLCVIGTSFFAEPRSEQQTRGRCGRQGEVGESRVFRSIDDEGLKEILSNAYLDMVLTKLGDVEEMDSSILSAALKRTQKELHEANFADIRKVNDGFRGIEKYRSAFIGLRMDLCEGLIGLDELLALWAGDKTIQQQLQSLQQGRGTCENVTLNRLWEQDESLRKAGRYQLQQALIAAFRKALNTRFARIPEEKRENLLIQRVCYQLPQIWQTYIESALDAEKHLKAAALDKFLEQEKNRLLWKVVEELL